MSDRGTSIPLPLRPDTVTRELNRLIETPIRQSIIDRHRLTRIPGSVVIDENGDEA